MGEKEQLELHREATVLILSTSEDSEGTSSMEICNVAMPGPSTSDIYPTPRKRARKNILNPDLTAALELQKLTIYVWP